ncbi:MAG: glutamate--tRNA ligase [Bacillota bacterium]
MRVRFAPSPTGPLHIGGARSALFNYLLAKKSAGDFIVRIEDTDRERSSLDSEENIKDSLRWLGLEWNEGVDVGGRYAPYRQMERLDTYAKTAQELIDKNYAYPCYCSSAELETQRQRQIAQGQTPYYLGTCSQLTAEERAAKEAQGQKPVLRFRVPQHQDLTIDDLVRGQVVFSSDEIGGDFIIMKSEGIPTYNFAVVVDDYLMKITHVIRGEEHLSNTPRQLLILEALGWEKPQYAHISLILGEDRSKMSKRHGSVSVVNYQKEGYLPEALVNFLALLGWTSGAEEEIFTLANLEEQFSLERVSKSPAVFDVKKLRWINSQYLRKLPLEQIAEGIKPFLPATWSTEKVLLAAQTLINHLEVFSDVKKILPLIEGTTIIPEDEEAIAVLKEEHVPNLLSLFKEKVLESPELEAADIKKIIKACGKELGIKGAGLFMPLRVALTGMRHGPDLDKLVALMGKEIALARLEDYGAKESL